MSAMLMKENKTLHCVKGGDKWFQTKERQWLGYDRRPIYLNYPERGLVLVTNSKAEARKWWNGK